MVFIAGGMLCLTPGLGAWVSLNTAGQSKRSAAIAMSVFFSQIGGVVGSNVFLTHQARKFPLLDQRSCLIVSATYPLGFGLSLGLLAVGNIILPGLYWILVGRVNKHRSLISEEEIRSTYSDEELAALGDKSPLYRYER